MILVCWEEKQKDTWKLRVRSLENVLAIAESRVIYRIDYTGAKRGSSTMESLQQATDGEGQRKNTEVSREQHYTEEVHWRQTGTGNRTKKAGERLSLSSEWGHWQHCMLHNLEHANPLRANITNARVKDCYLSAVGSKCNAASVEAVEQGHTVGEGYQQIWSAALPHHPVSFQSILLFFCLLPWLNVFFCSFKLFFKK